MVRRPRERPWQAGGVDRQDLAGPAGHALPGQRVDAEHVRQVLPQQQHGQWRAAGP